MEIEKMLIMRDECGGGGLGGRASNWLCVNVFCVFENIQYAYSIHFSFCFAFRLSSIEFSWCALCTGVRRRWAYLPMRRCMRYDLRHIRSILVSNICSSHFHISGRVRVCSRTKRRILAHFLFLSSSSLLTAAARFFFHFFYSQFDAFFAEWNRWNPIRFHHTYVFLFRTHIEYRCISSRCAWNVYGLRLAINVIFSEQWTQKCEIANQAARGMVYVWCVCAVREAQRISKWLCDCKQTENDQRDAIEK